MTSVAYIISCQHFVISSSHNYYVVQKMCSLLYPLILSGYYWVYFSIPSLHSETTYFIVVSRHRCMYARYVHQVTSLHENILKASWRIHHFCFILFVLILYSRSYILFYFLIIMLKIHIFIFYSMKLAYFVLHHDP